MKQEKIKLGATQINNGFSGQYYLPYSIGLLYAFVLHNSKNPKKTAKQLALDSIL